MTAKSTDVEAPRHFITDVAELRRRACENIESGNVTSILTDEEEHVNEMHDLLVGHEGVPMLPAR